MKKQNGITLIALVISIIVMLILAGVSINAIVGENGILTKAQKTLYMQSVAILEEFLQMEASNYITEENSYETQYELLKSKYPGWFYQNKQGYVIDAEGHALYLIRKSGLPQNIQEQLVGGNASYASDFYAQKDVYGVTSDLKVYYCSNGTDTILGVNANELDADNPFEEAYPSDSILAQIVNGGTSSLSNQDLKSIIELTIDSNDEVSLLKELKNLVSLKKLTLKDITFNDLQGIELAENLLELNIQNCKIGNYSNLADSKTLNSLYLINTTNEEVNKFTSIEVGIGQKEISSLKKLGIYGTDKNNVTNVADISGLANLSTNTKESITHLYLQYNSLTSLRALSDFTGVEYLKIEYNSGLTSLQGVENMKSLQHLYAKYCDLGNNVDKNTGPNSTTDALSGLVMKNSLYYVNLEYNTNLKYVKYLADAHKKADGTYGDITIAYLYLAGCTSLLDSADVGNIFSACGKNYTLESKYTKNVVDTSSEMLNFSKQTLTESEFRQLENKTNLKYLNLEEIILTNDDNSTMSNSEINALINEVLSTCSGLTHISLGKISALNTIEFVKGKNLIELLLNGTSVTTGTTDSDGNYIGLELLNSNCPYLITTYLDNSTIDITKIQGLINKTKNVFEEVIGEQEFERLWKNMPKMYWYQKVDRYGFISTQTVLSNLDKCYDLEYIRTTYSTFNNASTIMDLTGLTKLKYVEINMGYLRAKFPSNLLYFDSDNSGGYLCDFSECINLTLIKLWNQNGTQEAFDNIVNSLIQNTELEEIILDRFYISDLSSLSAWSNKTKLKTLNIWDDYGRHYGYHYTNSRLTLTSLDGLENLSNLENLTIGWNNKKLDISALAGLTNLKNLNLNDNCIEDITPLENLTELTVLNLHGNDIKDISALSRMSKLENLDISSNKISCLKSLEGKYNLSALDIKNNVLYNYGYYQNTDGSTKYVNNVSVLGDLNIKGALKKLYIDDNFIDDLTVIEELEWEEYTGW